jgi:uncharacterized tellurite resistance protein B-like protein
MDPRNKVIMKSLAEMAWADGQVTDEEKAMLFNVCLQLGASPEEAEELKEVLGEPTSPNEGELKDVLPDKASRLNVMRVLMTMSFIDGAMDFAEFDVIQSKAEELGLNPEELETLRKEALSAAESFQKLD